MRAKASPKEGTEQEPAKQGVPGEELRVNSGPAGRIPAMAARHQHITAAIRRAVAERVGDLLRRPNTDADRIRTARNRPRERRTAATTATRSAASGEPELVYTRSLVRGFDGRGQTLGVRRAAHLGCPSISSGG
jgi:hypothetical protein